MLSKVCIEHIGRSMAQHAQGHCSTAADGQSLVGGRKADQIVAGLGSAHGSPDVLGNAAEQIDEEKLLKVTVHQTALKGAS